MYLALTQFSHTKNQVQDVDLNFLGFLTATLLRV